MIENPWRHMRTCGDIADADRVTKPSICMWTESAIAYLHRSRTTGQRYSPTSSTCRTTSSSTGRRTSPFLGISIPTPMAPSGSWKGVEAGGSRWPLLRRAHGLRDRPYRDHDDRRRDVDPERSSRLRFEEPAARNARRRIRDGRAHDCSRLAAQGTVVGRDRFFRALDDGRRDPRRQPTTNRRIELHAVHPPLPQPKRGRSCRIFAPPRPDRPAAPRGALFFRC